MRWGLPTTNCHILGIEPLLRKAGGKSFLSSEELSVSPGAARSALGELWAREGNCEWSFKAPGLGRSLGTRFFRPYGVTDKQKVGLGASCSGRAVAVKAAVC